MISLIPSHCKLIRDWLNDSIDQYLYQCIWLYFLFKMRIKWGDVEPVNTTRHEAKITTVQRSNTSFVCHASLHVSNGIWELEEDHNTSGIAKLPYAVHADWRHSTVNCGECRGRVGIFANHWFDNNVAWLLSFVTPMYICVHCQYFDNAGRGRGFLATYGHI